MNKAPSSPSLRAAIDDSVVTDSQIRALLRLDPTLLDTAMIALHSTDRELRRLARRHFANLSLKAP